VVDWRKSHTARESYMLWKDVVRLFDRSNNGVLADVALELAVVVVVVVCLFILYFTLARV
jgi:hypothetical protein